MERMMGEEVKWRKLLFMALELGFDDFYIHRHKFDYDNLEKMRWWLQITYIQAVVSYSFFPMQRATMQHDGNDKIHYIMQWNLISPTSATFQSSIVSQFSSP